MFFADVILYFWFVYDLWEGEDVRGGEDERERKEYIGERRGGQKTLSDLRPYYAPCSRDARH